ncbi:MAG: hypothetical protein ACRDJT_00055 [Actinomycetota bacterium]
MPKRIFSLFLAAAMSFGILAALPASAGGGGDREVIRRGNCSGGTDWKYKVKRDDGRLEAEYEVDQNRSGDRWRVTLKHDGRRYFRGTRVTGGRSGSFDIERKVSNHRGVDRFRARARNLRTNEVCGGRVSF